ncbi:MAG: DNA ligase-1 [Limisphaerales bacterium]|jgi:DNA ligase-1
MNAFSFLIQQLDQSNKTNTKIAVLVEFFETATEDDKLWMLALFTGRKPRKTVTGKQLRTWSAEFAQIPDWMFMQCYRVVGDLAETISLLLPAPESKSKQASEKGLVDWIDDIRAMTQMDNRQKQKALKLIWSELAVEDRFAFHKLITGAMRLELSQKLVVKALAKTYDIEPAVIAHRLMGNWTPDQYDFQRLVLQSNPADDISKPYPFYLAHQFGATNKEDGDSANELSNVQKLGMPHDWQAEWKWDGIRGQLIHRNEQLFLWSRGKELITDCYPELSVLAGKLPEGLVLDGELIVYKQGRPLSFQLMQQRIGRKQASSALLRKAPVLMMVYDILEWEGVDIRTRPLNERMALLDALFENLKVSVLLQSERIKFKSWEALVELRAQSREKKTEGLMLKRKSSVYKAGRKRGDWWKWKVDPYSVDAVMIYAQSGSGSRAGLYTDYTFGLWDDNILVPFTKAYSGLTDKEIREVDIWIKANSKDRFGPVRVVDPELVFEIGFEGIAKSSRHKAGVALRFPRMLRWRKDKKPADADSLEFLLKLMEQDGSGLDNGKKTKLKDGEAGMTGLLFPPG